MVQVVTTVLKFVPLAVIGIVGLFFIDGGNYEPFSPHGTSIGLLLARPRALTLWAFIGLESATVPAEEVKDPERTIPRATIIGTVLATLLYVVATVSIMGILPTSEAGRQNTSPFAAAAGEVFGGGWDKVIAVVALISTAGALNGWIMLQGRVPLAAAEDGMFPAAFARVHGTRRTPVFGLVVLSVLVTGLMLMNYTKGLVDAFTFVILLATYYARAVRLLGSGADVPVARGARDVPSPSGWSVTPRSRSSRSPTACGRSPERARTSSTKGFVLMLAGVPVYIGMRWWQRRGAPDRPLLPDPEDRPFEPEQTARRSGWRRCALICPSSPGDGGGGCPPPPAAPPRRLRGGHAAARDPAPPRLELQRLTPRNKDALLFDDVLWVKRARQEHDAFADALAERGVEVLYLHACWPRRSPIDGSARGAGRDARRRDLGPRLARAVGEWLADLPRRAGASADRRDHLDELPFRSDALAAQVPRRRLRPAAAAEPPVHARHVGVDLRRRVRQRDGQAGAPARGDPPRRDLPPPPDVRRRAHRAWSHGLGGPGRARGRRRARDRQWLRARRHGRAHRPAGVEQLAERLFEAGAADAVIAVDDARAALDDAPRHGHDDGRRRRVHDLPGLRDGSSATRCARPTA